MTKLRRNTGKQSFDDSSVSEDASRASRDEAHDKASHEFATSRPPTFRPRHTSFSHSAYEETIKRSEERMEQISRDTHRMSDMQSSLRYSEDDPRAARLIRRAYERSDSRESSDYNFYRERSDFEPATDEQADKKHSLRVYNTSSYHTRPATSAFIAPERRTRSVFFYLRAAACALLLLLCLISTLRIFSSNSAIREVSAQIDELQANYDASSEANDQLNSVIDDMDATIEDYEDVKANAN